jgi:hypothetical protein
MIPKTILSAAGEEVASDKSIPHGETATFSFLGLPGDVIKFGRWLATKTGLPIPARPRLGD